MTSADFLAGRTVVVSRPFGADDALVRALKKHGAAVCAVTAVRRTAVRSAAAAQKAMGELKAFDWIAFTSAAAVAPFAELVRETHGSLSALRRVRIAAVGPATAVAVRHLGLTVRFVPKTNTAKALAQNLDGIREKRILLPRARAATPELPRILRERGAHVTELAVYATALDTRRNAALEKLIAAKNVDCFVFTSPSTVRGLVAKARGTAARRHMTRVLAVVIGPVTAAEAERQGFKNILVASTHTKAGIVRALRGATFTPSP